ncbi:MAG: hypothetical protein M3335_07230, partial [Actinomycetota bacterium]|nr:hypothetical protein [Actinomycetota bacterium]
MTTFVAKRPGLFVRIHVEGSRIVGTSTISRVRCADGSTEIGSGTVSEWNRFPIGRTGRFKKRER